MALLGRDFKATTPTDNDYVRAPSGVQLASVLRDLKGRIQDFFDRSFLTEEGSLWPQSIPVASLKSLTPSPVGTGGKMTVNTKGLFTRVEDVSEDTTARVFRAVFHANASKISSVDNETSSAVAVYSVDNSPLGEFDNTGYLTEFFQFHKFEFVVPQGVYRVKAILVGAGIDYLSGYTPSRQREVAFATTPGSILHIWVGETNGSPSRLASADGSKYIDSGAFQSPSIDFPDVNLGWGFPYLKGYGTNGTVASTLGTPGVVILEWYA